MIRVLVVDDEPSFARSLVRAVEAEGHEVELADSGEEAIRVAARFRPDVLVTDWMLGSGMNGVQLSAALSPKNPSMRTIVITGYSAPDIGGVDNRPEIVAVLEKPFRPSHLLAVILRVTGSPDD